MMISARQLASVLTLVAACWCNSGCIGSSTGTLAPTPSGLPEWNLAPYQVARYDFSSTRKGSYLSVRFSVDLPHPLGNTFVRDLAIVIKNPAIGKIPIPDERLMATLARPAEIANMRTGLIMATGGFVELLEETDSGFRGAAKLEFTDTLEDDAKYIVIARFDAPSK